MFKDINLGDLSSMFSQLQGTMQQLQTEGSDKVYTAKSGGGLVKASINGNFEVVDIEIDSSLFEDRESLQILLISAVNDGIKMVIDSKKLDAVSLFGKLAQNSGK